MEKLKNNSLFYKVLFAVIVGIPLIQIPIMCNLGVGQNYEPAPIYQQVDIETEECIPDSSNKEYINY